MSFRSEVMKLAFEAGGSPKTREARLLIVRRLAVFLRVRNIQIRQVDHLKLRHVQDFVQWRRDNKVGLRSLQNEMSAIRVVLRKAGREKLARLLVNKALGIAGASRDGTKTAMSAARFAELHARVLARDPAMAAVIELQRALGLRAEEAVKACWSLATWERQLLTGRPVHLTFGSKGGKARDIWPIDRERVLKAVRNAKAITKKQNGVLIAKPNEKEAMSRYRNVMYEMGFRGKESGHSLRYAFTQDQIKGYLAQGLSEKEALANASMDLGHGDGRGRYIRQVYAR